MKDKKQENYINKVLTQIADICYSIEYDITDENLIDGSELCTYFADIRNVTEKAIKKLSKPNIPK